MTLGRTVTVLTPIAGARGALGMTLQCLAGAVGGALFGIFLTRFSGLSRHKQSGRRG